MTRALAALVTWVLLSLLTAAPASAHAVMVGTSPSDGDVVQSAPHAVIITFNEPVEIRQVSLVGSIGPTALAAHLVNAEIHAPLPAGLDDGTYVVNWRVVSEDGHPIGGAFSFSIGYQTETVNASQTDSAATMWLIRIAQGLAYVGLLVACGLALFAVWSLRGETTGRENRLRRIGIVATVVAAVGLVIGLPAAELEANGEGLPGLLSAANWTSGLGSTAGFAAILGIAGAAVATMFNKRCLRLAGAFVGLGSLMITGHTRTFGPAILVLGADFVHVVAVGAWVGGLVGLALLIGTPNLAAIVARFSKLAALLLAAAALSGIVLGWRILGSIDALTSTSYGLVLLVKTGLVVSAIGVAWLNRRWLVAPRSSALRAESAVLVSVAAFTGVLVHLNPVPPAQEHSVMKSVDGVMLHASIAPCAPGDNTVTVMVHGADVAAPEISARTADGTIGPLTLKVTEAAEGHFTAAANLLVDGEWTIDIGVRISTYREASAILTCTP